MEQELDQNIETEEVQEVVETTIEAVHVEEDPVAVKYSGSSLHETLTDFLNVSESEEDSYILNAIITESLDTNKDYTPEEIDHLFESTNLDIELLEKIENSIIDRNDTNISRKESFANDVDSDLSKLDNILDKLNESIDECNTIACSEGCESIKTSITKLQEQLSKLKESYNGDRAVWINNFDILNEAYNNGEKIILLPDEEEA